MNELFAIGSGFTAWAQQHPLAAGVSIAVATMIVVLPPLACWWLLRRTLRASHEAVQQVESRLSHVCSAVEMLTDTTESGLQQAFTEIQRLLNNDLERMTVQAGLQTRIRRAANDGRTAREVAQREGVSEGEAHLRMMLSKSAAARAATRIAAN